MTSPVSYQVRSENPDMSVPMGTCGPMASCLPPRSIAASHSRDLGPDPVIIATRTPSGATRIAVTGPNPYGRRTSTGLDDGPSRHTRARPPRRPAAQSQPALSQDSVVKLPVYKTPPDAPATLIWSGETAISSNNCRPDPAGPGAGESKRAPNRVATRPLLSM